ncbi:MAG TPA: HisA/HisF-related TIM barrel protein, partial [Candidatus Dormibacteraeota bacterium]|nr:HisA/HisF-related TIM barrel protein [Candidatus Dormibacteraeota bacterium]
MVVIPAIDILGGHPVRLTQGRYDQATVYGDDPLAVATRYAQAGAKRVHVVDLDAARGSASNSALIERMLRDSHV